MKIAIVVPFLALLPLSAEGWEASLFIGSQSYRSLSAAIPLSETGSGTSLFADADLAISNKTLYGFRVGYDVVDLGPCTLQVGGGYLPPVSSTATLTVTVPGLGSNTVDTTYKSQQVVAGVLFNFKLPVAFGVGLEDRFEHYSATTFSGGSGSQNYARPWLRGRASYTFPGMKMKPFVGLEAAVPLIHSNYQAGMGHEPELKDAAPKAQIGVALGVRF